MNIDVAAFMQYVRDRGFTIEDYGIISGVRRFDISKAGDHNVYFDIDLLLWPDVTQEWLLKQADIIIGRWKSAVEG